MLGKYLNPKCSLLSLSRGEQTCKSMDQVSKDHFMVCPLPLLWPCFADIWYSASTALFFAIGIPALVHATRENSWGRRIFGNVNPTGEKWDSSATFAIGGWNSCHFHREGGLCLHDKRMGGVRGPQIQAQNFLVPTEGITGLLKLLLILITYV